MGQHYDHRQSRYCSVAGQHDDRRLFQSWMPDERDRVLRRQRPDGSWSDNQFGACYATSMNCLFLAIPEGLLPIFQR